MWIKMFMSNQVYKVYKLLVKCLKKLSIGELFMLTLCKQIEEDKQKAHVANQKGHVADRIRHVADRIRHVVDRKRQVDNRQQHVTNLNWHWQLQ